MRKTLIVDKVSSMEYGAWLSADGALNSPEADIERVVIPGRNGELIYSNRRFHNVDLTYTLTIIHDFQTRFEEYRAFLYSNLGYRRIEDDFSPNVYRVGMITGAIEPQEIRRSAGAGRFEVTFSCKPQRFLQIGDIEREYRRGGTINNPTRYSAKPLIRVYGYGDFAIGSGTVTVDQSGFPYIDIDCEAQDAYYNQQNCNKHVGTLEESFPVIPSGISAVSMDATISRLIITPRWWTV